MRTRYVIAAALLLFPATLSVTAQAGNYSKAQVGNLIRNVEDGVDRFRDYLKQRGEQGQSRAQSAQASGITGRRAARNAQNTDARKAQATQTKDELDDALGDLNRSTNRLRRKFDATPNYLETRAQVDQVLDDGRRVNQIMARGKYDSQATRYWTALRTAINELGRAYGLSPMGT